MRVLLLPNSERLFQSFSLNSYHYLDSIGVPLNCSPKSRVWAQIGDGYFLLLPIAPSDIFGCRNNPGDDRHISGALALPLYELEDFVLSEIEFPDDLLVLLKKQILTRGKSSKRCVPVSSPVHLAAVRWILSD